MAGTDIGNEVLREAKRVLTSAGIIVIDSFDDIQIQPKVARSDIDSIKSDYNETIRRFMSNDAENKMVNEIISQRMEFLEYSKREVQDLLCNLTILGFETRYEFSRYPLIPRGNDYLQEFQAPFCVIGKKTFIKKPKLKG